MTRSILTSVVVLAIALIGCRKNDTVSPSTENTPVVANTANAFSFTLAATSYTATNQYTMSFSTDTIACSLTITGKTTGSGSLTVADSNYSIVYADSSLNNQVTAFTQSGKGIPKRISIVFNDYTGTITFALARQGNAIR